jgi:hypothetical protein
MPLEFADFAHHYDGSGLSEPEQRAEFETFADIMECLARYFWQDHAHDNKLGIRLDGDTLALIDQLDSGHSLQNLFNEVALGTATRKKEP